ncbi:oxidoreductase [Actinoplanes rectilineatus]|uniref:oxidoreductase n=1 Tax=Actinoplanes rectilineatus TaxID=113571 RepID=UPI0005F2D34A|nr:oxidoreductase [Actinoplanes rectilineatus]
MATIPDQSGRLVVVTGANSGIGYVTARELARRGAHVTLACRSGERGEAALGRLRAEVPGARLELRQLDLAGLASVRAFAGDWHHGRLDLLVNNAGVAVVPFARTRDGFEMHFGVNHLGTFALTGLMLPHLLAGREPRVVTVGSEGHRARRFDFANLDARQGYRASDAYVWSKRANLLFAVELQRRAARAGWALRSMAVAPGLTRTNILTGGANRARGQGYHLLVRTAERLFFQNVERGARTSLHAATADLPGGSWVVPRGLLQLRGAPTCRPQEPALHDAVSATRLWELSEELTGVVYPRG